MKTEKRRIALVWIYVGQSPSERLESIGTIDAGHMELIAVGNVHVQRAVELFSFANPDRAVRAVESVSMAHLWDAVPDDVGALVFWIDDEKLGQSPSERLESIGTIDAGHMELIAVGNVHVQRAVELFSFANPDRAVRAVESVSMAHLWDAVPDDVGALVFWISPGFPLERAKPLLAEDPSREQHLHYWDGNALAISRSMAESVALRDMNLRGDCLLTFMSDIVERSGGVAGS